MRTKKGSLLLCGMLLSGFLLSILVPSIHGLNPDIKQESSVVLATESTHRWFHDGSNMTGFGSPVADLPTMGSLTSSGSYFYATDLGTDSGWHGPGMSYTLEEPFKVSQLTSFDVEIEFDCSQTTNRLGALNVILYDSNELPIVRYIVSDAWADDRQMKLPITWYYLDETSYTTPYSEPDWVTFSPFYDAISLTNNSNGFEVDVPDIGVFDIMVPETEDLDRTVTYVTIRFLQADSWTYCEEIFIHSINLEWVSESVVVEPSSATWHHDCSNTSYFEQSMTWNMDWWWETYTVSDGTMSSDGDKLSFSGLTQASGDWYGPIFTHTFSEPFQLNDLLEFKADFDIDNTDTSDAGILRLYLCDAEFMPVVELFCSDSWDWRSYGHNRVHYRFGNGSYLSHGNTDYITWTTFQDTLRLWAEEDGNLYAEVPGFGQALLLESEFVEAEREVLYLVLQPGRLAHYSWWPASIDDIQITLKGPEVPTSSTTTSLTNPTSPVTIPEGIPWEEFILPISIGSGVVIILVVGVICMSRKGSSAPLNPSQYDW
jgi:hypothetical protein